jgi:hypothetical protein
MRQFIEQNRHYIDSFSHLNWDFCVYHLIDYSSQETNQNINLADWIEHPFTYNNGRNIVYGFLPIGMARESCNLLNELFAEIDLGVLLEENVSCANLRNRLYHPDEFLLSLIHFDLYELEFVQQEVGYLLAIANDSPSRLGELDRLLDIVSEKGINGLSKMQRLRLDQLSTVNK